MPHFWHDEHFWPTARRMRDRRATTFDDDDDMYSDWPGDYFGMSQRRGNPLRRWPDQNSLVQSGQNVLSQGKSAVHNDRDSFKVDLDCKNFKPGEVKVTVDENKNQLIVHGSHQERSDKHGHISREFTRKYVLPQDVQMDKVQCAWDNNANMLRIDAPKQQMLTGPTGRSIPIMVEGNTDQQQQQIGQQQEQTQQQPIEPTSQAKKAPETRHSARIDQQHQQPVQQRG